MLRRLLPILLFGALILGTILVVPRLVAQFRATTNSPPTYDPPDFTLTSLDGEAITLSSQRGRPVVLFFVASWCEVCREEMPMMVDTYLAHRPHDVQFLAVDSLEEREAVEKFRDEFKIPFPILLDSHGLVLDLYQIKGTPTNFFIDRRGKVRDLVIGGPLSRAYLEKEITPLLEIATR